MDPGNSTENGAVVEKTASQLKKEAQRLAKLEKFNKKKEKEAALAENQNQVSGWIDVWMIFLQVKLSDHGMNCLAFSWL